MRVGLFSFVRLVADECIKVAKSFVGTQAKIPELSLVCGFDNVLVGWQYGFKSR